MALTGREFNAKFKGSPVQRAKRRGYLRNVAVALGNHDAPAVANTAAPVLAHTLQDDPQPLVRGHAAWALGQLGGELAELVLQQVKETEMDALVLEEILPALERLSPRKDDSSQ